MATELQAMAEAALASPAPISLTPQPEQHADTETRSRSVMGSVSFKLSNLRVEGLGNLPADPSNSPYIVAENEAFRASVDIEFNQTPLSELLMCLGTKVSIDFGFEGFGQAPEIDLNASIITQKGQYKYTISKVAVPNRVGLTSGLYEIGAVAEVGPVENKCTTKIWGHGYIEEVLLEVYPAGEE
jgi:hypothetical protein